MKTPNDLTPAGIKAWVESPGGFGAHGSSEAHRRYAEPINPRSRRRCHCGCGKRATHLGMANGVGLAEACELGIARWVKTGRVNVARRIGTDGA